MCPFSALLCSFCVMLFVRLCVYVMACICCLCIDCIGLFCACCSVTLLSFVVGVYGSYVVWCVAGGCVIGLSCVCVLLLLVCVRACCFCYGVNAFPVCDCILYVPSLRCSFSFCVTSVACLCVYGMACFCCLLIDVIGLFCV